MVISIIVIGACWAFAFYEMNFYRENIIETFSSEQYEQNNQLTERIQTLLKYYMIDKKLLPEQAENLVIKNVIEKQTNSDDNYTFLYGDYNVLFEKNSRTTKLYGKKTFYELFDFWKYDGGYDLENFQRLLKYKLSGSTEVVKSSKSNKEILSWKFIRVNDRRYIIGISSSEDFVLKKFQFEKHALYIYMNFAVFTIFTFVIVIILCLNMFLKPQKLNKLKDDLAIKNVEIQKLTSKIHINEEMLKKGFMCDELTGFYNERFFFKIIHRIDVDIFLPIFIEKIHVDLVDIKINNQVILKISDIIRNTLIKEEIISILDNQDIIIILVNAEKNETDKLIKNLRSRIKDEFQTTKYKIYFESWLKYDKNQKLEDFIKNLRENESELHCK